MAQLPPVNSGPYSQLPSPNDPTLVEAAAQQITTSSLNNYGALPNPEAAYESLVTQSVPSLVGAIQSQDPQYRSVLSSLPAGSTQQPQVPAQVPAGLVNPDPTGTYNFNQAQYKAMLPTLLQNPANSSWKSFGEIPALNQGYMQSVETLQNPTRIKQWQSLLQKQQFYSGSVSGVFDTNTKAAFEEMMASRAIPVALYSQDQTQQAAAASLLGSLGYDMQTLQTDAYHDPVMQHQMVTQWMQAQGPDQKFGDKSELDNYVGQFGAQNLPASWQSVYSAANNPLLFIGQGITKIPIIGALGGLLTNNILPRELQANSTNLTNQLKAAEQQQAKQENLSPTQLEALMSGDQQTLANVVSQVQQGSGFMGFMDVYDRAKTNALLTAHFLFADAATIIGGPIQGAAGSLSPESSSLSPEAAKILGSSKTANFNPFDPNSIIGQQVAASDGNISQGLFGADWATKNPMLAAITNTATNMADDPISYIPGAAYEKLGGVIGSGSRALMRQSAGLGAVGKATVDGAIRLGDSSEMANLIMSIKDHPDFGGVVQIHDMFGGFEPGVQGERQAAAIGALLKDPTHTADHWRTLITEMGFEHYIANLSGMVTRKSYLNHLGQVTNVSKGGWRGALASMGMTEHLGHLPFKANFGDALQEAQDWGVMAGLSPSELRPLIDGFVGIPEEQRIGAFMQWKAAVIAGFDKKARLQGYTIEDAFNASNKRLRTVFGAQRAEGGGDVVAGYMADPKVGGEVSWSDLNDPDPNIAAMNQQIKNLQDIIHLQGGMIDGHPDLMAKSGLESTDVGTSAVDAAHQSIDEAVVPQINKLRDALSDYKKANPETRRPSPAIAEQLRDNYTMPFSMRQIVTELNPVLRKWDKAQHALGMSLLTELWKPWVLANLGTSLRIVTGEDLIRPGWEILFRGHPLLFTKLMGEGIGKAIAAGTIPDRVALPLSRLLRKDGVDEAGNVVPAQNLGVNVESALNKVPKLGLGKVSGQAIRRESTANLEQMGAGELAHGIMSKYLSEVDPEVFAEYRAHNINYDQMLPHVIDKWSNSSLIRPYLDHIKGGGTAESARQVMADTISKSDEPGIAEIRRLHPNVDAHAALLHEFVQAHMEIPELRDMWMNGKTDPAVLKQMLHDHGNDPTYAWPVIFAPRNTLAAQHFIAKALNKYPQWFFDKHLSPSIAAARNTGFMALRGVYIADLKQFYQGRVDWPVERIEDAATSMALAWNKRNLYMGQRTMLGAQLRNVMPFWGATANMSRFYLREALSHPYSGDATLRLAKWSQDQQSQKQQYVTGGQGFLSMLQFTGGDALSIDPFHMFFLTSDGINSFVPGTGPWVNLLTQFVPGHQQVAETLAGTPLAGFGGLDSQTGAAQPIIPWVGQIATGIADTIGGLLGNTKPVNLGPLGESVDAQTQQEDELIRQREEQGQPVKPGDESNILSEVGRKFLLEGALRWATPLTPSIVNQPGQTLTNALNAFNAATSTTEKDSLVAAELNVSPEAYQSAIANQTVPQLLAKAPKDSPAVAMAYFDSNVTAEQRDIIGAEHPWVTAYAQSFYDRPIDPETGKPQQTTLGQFNTDLAAGGISLENATTYINKIQTARQIQQGWLAVDQLNNAKYAFMRQNGLTTQSSLYKQWDQEVYQPALVNIANSHPAWNTQFGSGGSSGTTLSAEANRTSALRTVMSLNVIPQDPAFETTSSTLWRQALVWRDQASQQIAAMQMGTHSTAEVQLVMDGLQQRLSWLAQQDPTFAQQLDGYSFGKWEDVVTLESDEIRNQELYGLAS